MGSVSFRYEFTSPVEEIWDLLILTDRINRAMGLPKILYTHEPRPDGGTNRYGVSKLLFEKWGTVRWLELPYEWVRYRFFRVERRFESGPLKKLKVSWEMTPGRFGGTSVEIRFDFEPAWPLVGLLVRRSLGNKTRKSFKRIYDGIQKTINEGNRVEFPFKDSTKFSAAKLADLRERMERQSVEPAIAERLLEFLQDSGSADLIRIRPFELARAWKMSRTEVLTHLLRVARAGVLNLSWDLICPSCHGPTHRSASLADFSTHSECDACNIKYGAEVDESVELTFSVNPAVRKVDLVTYCVGGPGNTRHILAELLIPSAGEKTFTEKLTEGFYRIRAPQSKKSWLLKVASDARALSNLEFDFSPSLEGQETVLLAPGEIGFRARNGFPGGILFIFEKMEALNEACTAAYLSTFQSFRDLFSSEVLKRGEELKINAVALLFTDLKGSTPLYGKIGDARAFDLVQQHFDVLREAVVANEGSLVKTIGDAVMASFSSPEKALAAAIQSHQNLKKMNRDLPEEEQLKLKIGIHYGSSFLVNINDRLDYFGSTVNLAARTEGQCEGGDVVFSDALYQHAGVKELIRTSRLEPEKFTKALKGFTDESVLYRIRC